MSHTPGPWMKYYIQRTIGNFTDTLSVLWEGNDLPTFRRDGNPYLFSTMQNTTRVLWRLQAKYPTTMETPLIPSQPIVYNIESIDTTLEVQHAPEQHLAMFM